jgi:hypothetical protein
LGWDKKFSPTLRFIINSTPTQYPNIYEELDLKALLITKNISQGFNLLILSYFAFEFTCVCVCVVIPKCTSILGVCDNQARSMNKIAQPGLGLENQKYVLV